MRSRHVELTAKSAIYRTALSPTPFDMGMYVPSVMRLAATLDFPGPLYSGSSELCYRKAAFGPLF